MSGLNTLLQTWFGTRLPTVMGPSFAYIISVLAIINDLFDNDFQDDHEVCILVITKYIIVINNSIEVIFCFVCV